MQIKDYTTVKETANDDIFLIDGGGGTRTIKSVDAANDLSKKVTAENARNMLKIDELTEFDISSIEPNTTEKLLMKKENDEFGYSTSFNIMQIGANQSLRSENHKSVYRDKNLGSVVTDEQWAAIADGTFKDMFVGDYWRINGVDWHICDFDYWKDTGDNTNDNHHLVIMTYVVLLENIQMNFSNTTEGGYVNSHFRASLLPNIKSIITAAFPEEHLYKHRELLSNVITDGIETGWEWVDSDVELPTLEMLTGITHRNTGEVKFDYQQLSLCRVNTRYINNRKKYWVRNVYGTNSFFNMDYRGSITYGYANSTDRGIRPVFGIC